MAKRSRSRTTQNDTAANVGYEAQLWQMADALRVSMGAVEYEHVVLASIFTKYIADAFEGQHDKLAAEKASGADPEDLDEYRAQRIFWVPTLLSNTKVGDKTSRANCAGWKGGRGRRTVYWSRPRCYRQNGGCLKGASSDSMQRTTLRNRTSCMSHHPI